MGPPGIAELQLGPPNTTNAELELGDPRKIKTAQEPAGPNNRPRTHN